MTRTALNIFATDKPSRLSHGKIEAMSREDSYFWQRRRERSQENALGAND
jgi:hypothetical protein